MQYSAMFNCHSGSSVFCSYWCYETVIDCLPIDGSIIIVGAINNIFYLNSILEGIVIIYIIVISFAVAIILDVIIDLFHALDSCLVKK